MKFYCLLTSLFISILLLVACEPSPQELARARQIDMSTQATADAAAIDAAARATVSYAQSQATATVSAALAQATIDVSAGQIRATATALAMGTQYDERVTVTNSSTAITREWAVAVLGVTGGLTVLLLAGLAVVALIRARVNFLPRDASGQLPGILKDGVVTDPQRQLGAVAIARKPDALLQLARAMRYLSTGKVDPLPNPSFTLPAGVDADHLLEAARTANQVAATAAMFQPGDSRVRSEKLELTKGKSDGLLGGPQSSFVKVTMDAPPEMMRAIAEQLGDQPPAGGWQIEAPRGNVAEQSA